MISIGRVVGVFGTRGEVKVSAADPAELRPSLSVAARCAGRPQRRLVTETVRPQKSFAAVRFREIADRSRALELIGAELLIEPGDLLPLPPGTYRDADLVGLRVVDEAAGDLGVEHYPTADMLVVGPKRLLVPLLKAYRSQIDRRANKITLKLPPGFEEL